MFKLSETHEEIRKLARSFADNELKPVAAELDKKREYPAKQVKKRAELGLMGVAVPDGDGGAGLDNLAYAIAMEEISRGCASTGVVMSVNNSLYCDPVMKFATPAKKKIWLEPFAKGGNPGGLAVCGPRTAPAPP